MRVLVTGASGRVGRRTVTELLRRGHEVIGFDLVNSGTPPVDFRVVQGSLEDAAAIESAVADAEAVIHLGALMSWMPADTPKVYGANVTGTFNLLEAVSRRGLKRLIFASSGEVYPELSPAYLPVDEHHPTRPTSAYGLTKLLGEDMVWFYARRFKIPTVVLRFEHTQDAAELLDPDSFFSGPRFFLRSKIRQQERYGNEAALAVLRPLDNGQEQLLLQRGQDGTPFRMPICDTRDLVEGILLGLESPRAPGETIGIGPDEPVSFDEAVALIQQAIGLPITDVRLPVAAVNYSTSNAKARELLGFRPRYDFRTMLQEAVVAYHRRNRIS